MKTCTECHRLYPDDGGFCPVDGKALLSTNEAQVPTDAEDKRVGAKLCGGRYQIWRRVADGGMGRVYQALDLTAGRSVALKILHAEVAQDPVQVERFKREFECSRALPHDYIVEVLAFEKTEDHSYALVMEYLEGEELRTLLKREKVIPPERLVRMLSHAAIALQAAHDRKIVHRDLKPDNIFLCGSKEGDQTKILDFGSVRDNSVGAKKLTVMGTTIGSPFYMSPEQAQALPELDHRADVWSMAAIAYECLTGTIPFRGTTGPSILLAILSQEPTPPSEAGKKNNVPATLDPVIEEALAKNAAIRVPSMGALVDRIGQAYGLDGSHAEWARTSQEELGARIRNGLPAALARYVPAPKAADLKGMDDAFKAGSNGGPSGSAFQEDMIMGVPSGPPKWIYAAVAVVAVLIGAVAVLLVR
ncbi:Serine/threonine-protein kinase PknA [Minicystis rosea]|nr:Serine/threonine-protein kinase PknA [Minicystis rosea]